jgi:type II secretory pathway pseudopilin PulG
LTLDERGLTLAEVVAAVLIIGIGLTGLMIVVPISSSGLAEGNQLTTATFLAEERLEHVKNAPWTSSPDNDCVGIGSTAAPTVPVTKSCTNGATTLAAGDVTFVDEPSVVAPYTGYSRTVRIQDCAATPCTAITTAGMRQVTVTISYRPLTAAGVAASDKSVTLTMLVAQR